MKITMMTPHYLPEVGGIEYHVYNLANYLSKKHEITIITSGAKYSEKSYENDLRVIRISSIAPPPYPYQTLSSFKIPIMPTKIIEVIKKEDPDILHVHGHHYPITWIGKIIGQRIMSPTVLTIHGLYALTWQC